MRVDSSVNHNLKIGLIATEGLSRRLMRASLYVADILNNTNASKIALGAAEMMPDIGTLGLCEKDAPRSPYYTPGVMVYVCPCKKRKMKRARYMSRYESPGYIHQDVFTSYDDAPDVLIYDNVS